MTSPSKNRQVRVLEVPVGKIKPSPENNQLYRPIDPADADIQALAESVNVRGVIEPIVLTQDNWILSGHRRHMAAQVAGLKTIPARYVDFCRSDDPDRFIALLREYNRQRTKSLDEVLREEVASADPSEAYFSLLEYREETAHVNVASFSIIGRKSRCPITKAKYPMLEAVLAVLEERRDYWPLTVRTIHYALLNDPPLKHASKPGSLYDNTVQSYKNLDDLLTRARLAELIPFEAIGDETRPVTTWNVFNAVDSFISKELDGFLKGYWRNLMQSQPNHIEIVGEKNTVDPIIRQVAMEYCIPVTTGRGYCSLPPRYEMAQRLLNSGKEQLVLLVLSDFDPEGEDIAHSFARSMRDDFEIADIHPIKVALTADQVAAHNLPPIMTA